MEDLVDGQTRLRTCEAPDCGITFIAVHDFGLCSRCQFMYPEGLPQEMPGAPLLNTMPPVNSPPSPQESAPPSKRKSAPQEKGEQLTEVEPRRVMEALGGYAIMDARMLNNTEAWIQLEGKDLPPMYLCLDLGSDGSLIAMFPPPEDHGTPEAG